MDYAGLCANCKGSKEYVYWIPYDRRVPGTPSEVKIPCKSCEGTGLSMKSRNSQLRSSLNSVLADMGVLAIVFIAAAIVCQCLGAPVPRLCPLVDVDGEFSKLINTPPGPVLTTRRRVMERQLEDLQSRLLRNGDPREANTVRERLVLVRDVGYDKPWSMPPLQETLRRASVHGKYHHLLYSFFSPKDSLTYRDFTDFGFWAGTRHSTMINNVFVTYDNLNHGFWVYVQPRWFVWRDGPRSVSSPEDN